VSVKRKQHSADFKARVAMAALSGEKTLGELSSEFGVHPTMISTWKQELKKRANELFARDNKAPTVDDAQKVIDDLHRKIGPSRVLPEAVHGGLKPLPTERPRRALLHLSHKMTLARFPDTIAPGLNRVNTKSCVPNK